MITSFLTKQALILCDITWLDKHCLRNGKEDFRNLWSKTIISFFITRKTRTCYPLDAHGVIIHESQKIIGTRQAWSDELDS